MKTLPTLCRLSALVCAGAFVLAGCSTPDSRIRENPEVFARMTPDQQAVVKAGQVAVGLDMDGVKLALGAPDSITIHTDASGQTQVWHYFDYDPYAGPGPYWGGYWGAGWGPWRGGRRGGWGGGWAAYDPWVPGYAGGGMERFRVTFDRSNRVSSIQQQAGT